MGDWSEELFQLWIEAAKLAGKGAAYLQRIGQVLEEWRQGKQPSEQAKQVATADISTANPRAGQQVSGQQPAATDGSVARTDLQEPLTPAQKLQQAADQISPNTAVRGGVQNNVAQPIPQNSIINQATVDLNNRSSSSDFQVFNQKPDPSDHVGTLGWMASMADELASHPNVDMDSALALKEKAKFARIKANELTVRGRKLNESEGNYFQQFRDEMLDKMQEVNPSQFAVDNNTQEVPPTPAGRTPDINTVIEQGVQFPKSQAQPIPQTLSQNILNRLGSSLTESQLNRLGAIQQKSSGLRNRATGNVSATDLMTPEGVNNALGILNRRATGSFVYAPTIPVSEEDARKALFYETGMAANVNRLGSTPSGDMDIMSRALTKDERIRGVRLAKTATATLNPQKVEEIRNLAAAHLRKPTIATAAQLASLINKQYGYAIGDANSLQKEAVRNAIADANPVTSVEQKYQSLFSDVYLPEESLGGRPNYVGGGYSVDKEGRQYPSTIDLEKARSLKQPFRLANPIAITPYTDKKGNLVTEKTSIWMSPYGTSRAGLPSVPTDPKEAAKLAITNNMMMVEQPHPDPVRAAAGERVIAPAVKSIDDIINELEDGSSSGESRFVAAKEAINKGVDTVYLEDIEEKPFAYEPHVLEASDDGRKKQFLQQVINTTKDPDVKALAQGYLAKVGDKYFPSTEFDKNFNTFATTIEDAGVYPMLGVGNDVGWNDFNDGSLGRIAGGRQVVRNRKTGEIVYAPGQREFQQSIANPSIVESPINNLFNRIEQAKASGNYQNTSDPVQALAAMDSRDISNNMRHLIQRNQVGQDLQQGLLNIAGGDKPYLEVATPLIDRKIANTYTDIQGDIERLQPQVEEAHPFLGTYQDIVHQIKTGKLDPNIQKILRLDPSGDYHSGMNLDHPLVVQGLYAPDVAMKVTAYGDAIADLSNRLNEKKQRAAQIVDNLSNTTAPESMVSVYAPASSQRNKVTGLLQPMVEAAGFGLDRIGTDSTIGRQMGAYDLGVQGRTIGEVANLVNQTRNLGLVADVPRADKILGAVEQAYVDDSPTYGVNEEGQRVRLSKDQILEQTPVYDKGVYLSPEDVANIQRGVTPRTYTPPTREQTLQVAAELLDPNFGKKYAASFVGGQAIPANVILAGGEVNLPTPGYAPEVPGNIITENSPRGYLVPETEYGNRRGLRSILMDNSGKFYPSSPEVNKRMEVMNNVQAVPLPIRGLEQAPPVSAAHLQEVLYNPSGEVNTNTPNLFYGIDSGKTARRPAYGSQGDYYYGRPTETGTVLDDLARQAMAREGSVATGLVPVNALVGFLQDAKQKRRFRY